MLNKFLTTILLFSLFLFGACFDDDKSTTTDEEEVEIPKTTISATPVLDSLIKIYPKNSNLYYERAKFYNQKNFQPKALVDVLSAIREDSSKVDYFLLASDVFIAMEQGEDAVEILEKGLQTIPKNEDLYIRAVEYSYYLKDYKKSMILVNDILKINKNNADAYFFKGMIHKSLGNANKAISSFQTCVEQDPTFYNAYMQLGVLMSANKNDLAISYYDNALRLKEQSREAFYGKGYHFQQAKKYNKAKAEYVKMIRNNRRDFQAFYNIGYCLMEQDSLEKANKHFRMASDIKVDYVDAIFMQGQISESIGDIKAAKIHYHTALKLLPKNETIKEALESIKKEYPVTD